VARPREFELEEVLDKAVETFWSKGYEATSIQDLVESMGIHRGSLYAAFEGKQGLFLTALDRYRKVVVRKLLDILDGDPSGKAAIRQFFAAVIEHVITGGPLSTSLTDPPRPLSQRLGANPCRQRFCGGPVRGTGEYAPFPERTRRKPVNFQVGLVSKTTGATARCRRA
jgi:AcrR family transcriptional regulator